MGSSPELKVTLFAGGAEVASTTDASIWLSTMAAITGVAPVRQAGSVSEGGGKTSSISSGNSAPEERFATELEVSLEQLTGAVSPSVDQPYIHLDHKYWESLKENTPPRGVGSVPGVVLAATLLLLWNRHANFGRVSAAMCDAVLGTIGHSEKNRARSLRGCEWIQVREDGLRLNPANTAAAIRLAKAYVTRSVVK